MKSTPTPSLYLYLFLLLVSLGCTGDGSEETGIYSPAPIAGTQITPPQILDPVVTPQPANTITLAGTLTSQPALTRTPPIQPTPTSWASCSFHISHLSGNFYLSRPIAPPGRDYIDPTYRFGATQHGQREPHTGVEFLNSTGTPILAAANGQVIFAGNDLDVLQSAWPNFYGNLIILEHSLPNMEMPLFTLYAHLSDIHVAVGDQVEAGQVIGLVGASGSAEGSHLHFEVRLGENHYTNTQNPELWLRPHSSIEGISYGAMAARLLDENGYPINIGEVVVETYVNEGETPVKYILEMYDWEEMGDSQPILEEHTALGDLPPGRYRFTFVYNGLKEQFFEVHSGEVTYLTICLDTGQ